MKFFVSGSIYGILILFIVGFVSCDKAGDVDKVPVEIGPKANNEQTETTKVQTEEQVTEEIIGTKVHVLPHERQIRWQERELTAFVHFTGAME